MKARWMAVLAMMTATTCLAAIQESAKGVALATLKRGDKVTLSVTYGKVPVFVDEKSCKNFLTCAKAANPRGFELIKGMFDDSSLELIKSGEEATVESIDQLVDGEGKPKKLPSLDTILNPVLVPYVVVRLKDRVAPSWVPVIYLKQPNGKPYGIESRFPVVIAIDNFASMPLPGKIMYVNSEDNNDIPIARGIGSYDRMIKAIAANDQVGIRELTKDGEMRRIPSGSRARVIERKIYTDIRAAEARFIDGPAKDEVWWIPEQFTSVPSIEIYPYQAVRSIMKAQPKKKR